MNTWFTTDKSNIIFGWDIEKENITSSINKKKQITSNIIDVIELAYIKLVAISSLDKMVTIWNFFKETLVIKIDLTHGGIHSMAFSINYQVILTAGYENSISIFSIHPKYFDHTLVGKLTGHNSMVTAIQVVQNTPMVVSADDNGVIKIWDIRLLKCFQTVDIGSKTIMSKLIDLNNAKKICFLGYYLKKKK